MDLRSGATRTPAVEGLPDAPDDDLCGKPLAVIAIMAFAIYVCTGLTVDLRFFDFPTAAIFLLVGMAIGWSDRRKRQQPPWAATSLSTYGRNMPERRALWASTEAPGHLRLRAGHAQRRCGPTEYSVHSHPPRHSAAAKIAAFARGAAVHRRVDPLPPDVVTCTLQVRRASSGRDPVVDQPARRRARCRAHARPFQEFYENSPRAIRR